MTSQWRQLALFQQGLASKQRFGKGLSGTRRAIEHLGYVQIDALSVVERAHHHILWNRVPGYDLTLLNQLVSEQHIFEYWFHAASYLPMRDYRFALPKMTSIRSGESRYYPNIDKGLMGEILARVDASGPLRSRDLDEGKVGRRALHKLFLQGDLMVCSRDGVEKVYDLAERCLPEGIDRNMPTMSEYASYLFDTTRRAHAVFTWKQLLHLKTGKPLRDAMQAVLDERLEAGVVSAFSLDGAGGPTVYVDTRALEMLEEEPRIDGGLKILSPFDNLVIHRDRLRSLFEFDYRIECYVTASKREFGYFCLPILFDDRLVGRIDCKAHRADQRFEVISLHLEDGSLDRERFFPALSAGLQRFADFNECPLLDEGVVARQSHHC